MRGYVEQHKISEEKGQRKGVVNLGTTDVALTIYIEGKGTVLKESPLMVLDAGSGKILAFGAESE